MTRLRRGRRRRPGGRRLHRDAARPGRRPGARCSTGRRYGSDTLSTHAPDAGRRPAAVPLGAAGPRSSAPGTPPIRRTHVPLRRRRAGAGLDPAQRRASTRCTRRAGTVLDRILVDARGRGRRGRAARRRRSPGCSATTHGRVAGCAARPGGRPARRCARRIVDRRRRDPLRRGPSQVGAPRRSGGAACRVRSLYRLLRRPARRPATSGPTATAAAAGLIPTNDGLTCVFVGTTPAADADAAPARAPRTPSRALLGAAAPAHADRLRGATPRRPDPRLGRRTRASCAGRGGRAGRWSATPATSRTRSPPTA